MQRSGYSPSHRIHRHLYKLHIDYIIIDLSIAVYILLNGYVSVKASAEGEDMEEDSI